MARTITFLLGLLTAGFVWATPALTADTVQKPAVVEAKGLNLRAGPSTKADVRLQLQKGDRITLLGEKDGWLKISYRQKVGYILDRSEFIRIAAVEAIPEPPAPVAPPALEKIKKKASAIEQKIRRQKSKADQISKSEADHLSALNKIDQTLNNSRHRIAALRLELSMLDDRITKTRVAISNLEEAFRINQAYVAKRLVALYKIRQLGTFHIMASAESMQEILFRKSTLKHILEHDNRVREKLVQQRMELSNLVSLMSHQKTEKLAKEKSIQTELESASIERSKRQTVLKEVRAQKELSLATLSSLKRTAAELDRTIQKLFETKKKRPATPTFAFADNIGRLDKPVKGKIVNSFGQFHNKKFNVVNFRTGINIRADQGEPIRAIWSGKTLFASWFKGYGNMMIIDHGNSYYSVYAHAQELFKTKGAMVEKGEVIATVGESGSLSGPQLYFEIRHHGRPLNPLKWIRKG